MDEPTTGGAEERARHEREAALHALAGSSPPTATLPTSPTPRPRLHRRLLFALLIVCVVIAGGLGWWRFSQHPTSTLAAGPLIIKFPDAHIRCPESIDWSPDGAMVAVFGDSWCPSLNVPPNPNVPPDPQVELYDAASWRVVKAIHLLPPAEATRPQVLSPQRHADAAMIEKVAAYIAYGVYWSPDGQKMRIGFGLDASKLVAAGDASVPAWAGWIIINTRTFAVSTTLAPQPPPPVVSPHLDSPYSSYQPELVQRHDLLTGAESYFPLAQALGYRWDASGHLEATTPLSAWESIPAAPPLGPVGDPRFDASFTIWQQAVVTGATTYLSGCSQPYFPVTIELSARSPDGRYVLDGPTVNARFAAPASAIPTPPDGEGRPSPCPPLPTTPSETTIGAPNFLAPLPIRDAGLTAALKALTSQPLIEQLALAWSPDGTKLAVVEIARRQAPAGHLTIYDCASGKVLRQYQEKQFDPALDQQVGDIHRLQLSWSPDSKQLLAYDGNRLVVLRGATLGG